MKAAQSSASSSAANAQQSITDALLDAWSDSQLKEWLDKNGVKVPQGSKRNELTALARKHRAKLVGDNVEHSATSAYGAATSKAGNQYAQATDDASLKAEHASAGAAYYIDWIKSKLGLIASDASASATSAASGASASATSAASGVSSSASSGASAASASASSAASVASKSGKKSAAVAGDAATESLSAGKHRASEAAQQATDKVKEEL